LLDFQEVLSPPANPIASCNLLLDCQIHFAFFTYKMFISAQNPDILCIFSKTIFIDLP